MTQLTILGASARAAACSARRAGFTSYAIDLFADRDVAALGPAKRIERYPQGFVAALAAAGDTPWFYTGGLENYPRLVDRLETIRPLLGNPGTVLRAVRDPRLLGEALHTAGFPFPRTIPASGRRVASSSQPPGNSQSQWLAKPSRSSGGLAIRFASQSDLKSPPRSTRLQHYIDGQAGSAVYVAARGQAALLGASRQLLGRDFGLASPFAYAGSIAPLDCCDEQMLLLRRLGATLASQFGLVGLFGVDFVQTDSALWPIEVNPRYTASVEVLEHLTGEDFIAQHVAACRLAAIDEVQHAPLAGCFGKAIAFAPCDGVVSPRIDELIARWNNGTWPGIADLPFVGQPIRAGHPIATVFADGPSDTEVEQALHARVKEAQSLVEP